MITQAALANLRKRSIASSIEPVTEPWVRHPAWLALPSVTGQQKFVGLHAVFPDSNFCAFTCAGNYTVDWGDGTTENVATGVTAYHQYDYNDVDLANTNGPVTFTDSGDLVNRTAHGFSNGQTVSFVSITSTTGISVDTTYYVVNATANTFQVSDTFNGTALTLTTDGSGALLPYKQAIVTITPNGGNLTSINLNVKHSQAGLQQYCTGWLDIAIEATNLTSLTISANTRNVEHRILEQFSFGGATGMTNCTNMFQNCYLLQSLPLFNSAAVTNFQSMFQGCYSLKSIPLLNTSSGTSFQSMFSNCVSLQTIPLLNTALVTSFLNMFYNCYSLQSIPQINTVSGLNFSLMFANCSSLRSIPSLNTSSGTNFTSMFSVCASLKSIPQLNTALGINFTSMFQNCYSLQTIPPLNTSAGTNFTSMFQNCYSLKSIPLLNTTLGTVFTSIFNNCYSLTKIPALNMASCSSAANFATVFTNCTSLKEILCTGIKYSFSIAGSQLSATALNTLYTNLASVTAETITVSNNWGTASDDPTIATAKGWTVTG